MFEKLFGKQEATPREKLSSVIEKELSIGVDQPSIIRAFESARKKNVDEVLGLSTEQILDIVRDTAITLSGPIEDTLYGGANQTVNNILSEIDRLKKEMGN